MSTVPRRNAAKTLDQIKEMLGISGEPDAEVISQIKHLRHYRDGLLELYRVTNNEYFMGQPTGEALKQLASPTGPLHRMATNTGRDPVITPGLHSLMQIMKTAGDLLEGQLFDPEVAREQNKVIEEMQRTATGTPAEQLSLPDCMKQYAHWKKYFAHVEKRINDPAFKEMTSSKQIEELFGADGVFIYMFSGAGYDTVSNTCIHEVCRKVMTLSDTSDRAVQKLMEKAVDQKYDDSFHRMLVDLKEIGYFDKTPEEKAMVIFGNEGMMHRAERGVYSATSWQHQMIVEINNAVETFSKDAHNHKEALRIICDELGLPYGNPDFNVPKALSQLTTALSIIRGLGKAPAVDQAPEVEIKKIPEPEKMLYLPNGESPGVYKVTQEWFDWFMRMPAGAEKGSVDVEHEKNSMNKAINDRIVAKINSGNLQIAGPLNVLVSWEFGDKITPPVVIFAQGVNPAII